MNNSLEQSPEALAMILKKSKPHLIEIDQKCQTLEYGTITVEMTVRAGVVAKMEYIETRKTWMAPKDK